MTSPETRETEWIPYTVMVEVPKLSDAEREELIASIQQAEADLDAGKGLRLAADEVGPWIDSLVQKAMAQKSKA